MSKTTYQELYDNFKKFNIIDSVYKLTMCFRTSKIKYSTTFDENDCLEDISVYGFKHHGKKYELTRRYYERSNNLNSLYDLRQVENFEKQNEATVDFVNEIDTEIIFVPDKKEEFSKFFGIDKEKIPEDFDYLMKNNIIMKDFIFVFEPITINKTLYLGLYEKFSDKVISIKEYNKKYCDI